MHEDLRTRRATAPRADRHLFILSNQQGARLTPATFREWCKRATGRYTPHGLRKNATNALFQSGCTTAEVASVTGHKTLAMLELYGRDRDQSKMSIVAMGKWSKTNQERENRNKKRSEEHTSELKSLMRITYAVFCLNKKTQNKNYNNHSKNKSNHN